MAAHNITTDYEHPIAALATPYGKSALAVVRVSGKDCIESLSSVCIPHASARDMHTSLTHHPLRSDIRCTIRHPKTGIVIDDGILTLYKAPHSYTGEDAAEISIHGSTISIEHLLDALYHAGVQPAQAGEFTKRAFLNGKIDLTQAEAIHAIIEAHSASSHAEAIRQLSGSLTHRINAIKDAITHIAATYAVTLDYPDDEIQESTIVHPQEITAIIDMLTPLITSYDLGKLQTEGAMVVLGGKTNAGKSSLFNVLLKEERAIVSADHGTTRDFLENHAQCNGIPLRLYDTAGLRASTSDIESAGIEKSNTLLKGAQCVLYVVDSHVGWTDADTTILTTLLNTPEDAMFHATQVPRIILVWNKIDIGNTIPVIPNDIEKKCSASVPISTKTYKNIDALQDALYKTLVSGITLPKEEQIVISSLRQKQNLEQCKDALMHARTGVESHAPSDMISMDIDTALRELGAITGTISSEDILDVVFSSFCVGK